MESDTVIRMRTTLHFFLFTIACLAGALPLRGQAPASPVRAEFHTVKASAFEENIETVGSLRANESVTLMAESPRRLAKVLCEEGLAVKAGDLLFQLDDAELQRAIEATFARRQTAMPSTMPIGLSDAFADETTKQTQWRAFLNKNKLQPMDLRNVIGAIRARATHFGFPRP